MHLVLESTFITSLAIETCLSNTLGNVMLRKGRISKDRARQMLCILPSTLQFCQCSSAHEAILIILFKVSHVQRLIIVMNQAQIFSSWQYGHSSKRPE